MLYERECGKELHAGTQLAIRHLHCMNEKINVRLAAQILSDSVADKLLFLKIEKFGFENVNATIKFIVFMNNAFDILNNRSKFSNKPYNIPISKETINLYRVYNSFNIKMNNLLSQRF